MLRTLSRTDVVVLVNGTSTRVVKYILGAMQVGPGPTGTGSRDHRSGTYSIYSTMSVLVSSYRANKV